MVYVHHGGWNKAVDAEIKLHTKLSRMTKGQLIAEGQKHGFNFGMENTKADMIVEIAADILERPEK